MAITWNYLEGAPDGSASDAPAFVAFFKALQGPPTFATTTGFIMQDGDRKILFEGSFSVTPFFPPSVTGGTIKGFSVYAGGAKMIEVSGHALDYHDLMDSLAALEADPQQNIDDLFATIFSSSMAVNGSPDADYLVGGGFADTAHGSGNGDWISTAGGADRAFGEDGNDVIETGAGDDFLSGGTGQDHLRGGAGVDTADYAEKTDVVAVTLNGPDLVDVTLGGVVEDHLAGIENLIGGRGNDILRGDGLNNRFEGRIGDDTLSGSGGNDTLAGEDGADTIAGEVGNDVLHGGAGRDLLSGGEGSDSFVFDVAPGKRGGKANADVIADFASGFDHIVLDGEVFAELKAGGPVKGKYFETGRPDDGNDYLVFKRGKLSYDPDGDGDGAMKLVARLGDAKLHADDILVG